MVEELTDNLAMMSDVLGTWKKPGQERRLIGNKGLSKAGKGLSPQPTHFKRVSMFSVTNKDIELEEALYGAPGPANVPRRHRRLRRRRRRRISRRIIECTWRRRPHRARITERESGVVLSRISFLAVR